MSVRSVFKATISVCWANVRVYVNRDIKRTRKLWHAVCVHMTATTALTMEIAQPVQIVTIESSTIRRWDVFLSQDSTKIDLKFVPPALKNVLSALLQHFAQDVQENITWSITSATNSALTDILLKTVQTHAKDVPMIASHVQPQDFVFHVVQMSILESWVHRQEDAYQWTATLITRLK